MGGAWLGVECESVSEEVELLWEESREKDSSSSPAAAFFSTSIHLERQDYRQ